MIDQNQKEKLYKFIEEADSIILISHENPDRDAIGSIISMYQILKKLGKDNLLMLNETGHTIKSRFLKYQDEIVIEPLANYIDQYDTIIMLDQGSLARVSKIDPEKFKNKRIGVIDHHLTKSSVECEVYIQETLSSNCQLIYEVFEGKFELDCDIAKSLLMGIFDDTGGFRYQGVDARTLEVAGKLLKTGVDISQIAEESRSISPVIFDAAKIILKNTVINKDKKMFYSYITKEEIRELGIEFNQIESAREASLSMVLDREDIDWGFFIKPSSSGGYSASFRAKRNTVNVEQIAKLFGGGGHKNAAGSKLKVDGNIDEVIDFVLSTIRW